MTNCRSIPPNTPTELIDFASMASRPRHIEFVTRQTYGAVTIGRYVSKPDKHAVLAPTQYVVLVQEGDPFEMEWLTPEAEANETQLMQPGDVHIHPSDTLVYKRWKRSSRMLFMAIEKKFVEQIVEQVFVHYSLSIKPKIGVRDTVIAGMAEAWREELQAQGAGGRLHAEALATALIIHVVRAYAEGESLYHVATGGMNGVRLRRVIDYIESNLKEDMSLLMLASVAGLGVDHFNTVFKAETGVAPHQFVNDRRIHHAKELLVGTKLPLSEVALAVGFSSQSHFTVNFRKSTATTPMRFRLMHKT